MSQYNFTRFKVGDYSLIIHKSAYHLFSVLILKRGFPSLQTRETFGEILSGDHRFLIPVVTVVTPHNWHTYYVKRHTFTQQKYCLSNIKISYN